jgi:succinate dehydrogenase / fumarate reductase cytochrome b subunit
MSSRVRALNSSVGTKLLIGITGLALVLYLIVHVSANMMVMLGPSVFNGTADKLERLPLLPVIELGLLAFFVIHVFKTADMFLTNRRARPVGYVQKKYAGPPSRKTFASSTMILSGLWLLAFIIIHVKAFKYSTTYEWAEGGKDFYRLEMDNFTGHPLVVGFYVLSMLVVGSHLWHGASSAVQSLGASGTNDPRRAPTIVIAGRTVAVLIAGGFITIALWAYFVAGQP